MMYVGLGIAFVCIYWICSQFFASKTSALDELIEVCSDDESLAKRLIALEVKKNPELSQKQAVEKALATYRRDMRR